MKKKRSAGVTIFSVIIIVVSVMFFVLLLLYPYGNKFENLFFTAFSTSQLICGISILKLKNWARILFICLMIILGFWMMPMLIKDFRTFPANLWFIFAAVSIFFFTRSKVKEQFK